MPTIRNRHQITETPDVARAIDLASKRWPGETRSALLRRLITVGGGSLERVAQDAMTARHQAILDSSGKYADAFEPAYLDKLRQDWPE